MRWYLIIFLFSVKCYCDEEALHASIVCFLRSITFKENTALGVRERERWLRRGESVMSYLRRWIKEEKKEVSRWLLMFISQHDVPIKNLSLSIYPNTVHKVLCFCSKHFIIFYPDLLS